VFVLLNVQTLKHPPTCISHFQDLDTLNFWVYGVSGFLGSPVITPKTASFLWGERSSQQIPALPATVARPHARGLGGGVSTCFHPRRIRRNPLNIARSITCEAGFFLHAIKRAISPLTRPLN
jgi:hypothetical protein